MRAPRAGGRAAERLYAVLLLAYPPSFREEYGPEMARTFREWRAQRSHQGAAGAMRFWASLGVDLVRSVPREWLAACENRLGAHSWWWTARSPGGRAIESSVAAVRSRP